MDEVESKTRYANKEPKRVSEFKAEDGIKNEKRFIYDAFQPQGDFLIFNLQDGAKSPWLKLWRDMLWAVLCAQPATRGKYQQRASGQPVNISDDLWKKLVKARKQSQKGAFITDSISGSIFIGAQGQNAEQVLFEGRIEHNLLLHFWQWATPIFVPQIVNPKENRREYKGYLLAIPEVADLQEFCDLMIEFWQGLSPEISGYRPRNALIDLPEEGGLEFLYHLAQHRLKHSDISDVILAVELYHQEKRGDNVRMLAAERLTPNSYLLTEYERLRSPHGNPLFKSLRIRNLIAAQSWHNNADNLFANYPFHYFIHTPESPSFYFFGADAKKHFNALIQDLERQEKANMQDKTPERLDDVLARRIYQLIGSYIRQKAELRANIKWADIPKNEKNYRVYPSAYREAVQKVATDAFLAMRGRSERDFIEYFTGTICSVPQYFGKEDEFVEISRALMDHSATVKNLAMLALSAHSWLPGEKNEAPSENE